MLEESSETHTNTQSFEDEETERKGKAVVVSDSIAGLSCTHALIIASWGVVVLEKTSSPATGCANGAGLGFDPLAQKVIKSWLDEPHALDLTTLPLTIDQNEATDGDKKINWMLIRDESFNFRAALWSDLYSLLYKALPPKTVRWGQTFLSFCVSDDGNRVRMKAKASQFGEIVEVAGDLLVAADGCLSSIRQSFFPECKLRFVNWLLMNYLKT
ncbi:uncharacterized protein LOC131007970 [Salvia miltiorrhiza]|uniref:uncharacterized protein LOC131007970 n=1 Tax=Salvia miltiorrhiza TaxID=226208 RepID=UPI0025AC9910|nr:uncharacterized protein LOC131007970 [Salvia miltiorrhiza]